MPVRSGFQLFSEPNENTMLASKTGFGRGRAEVSGETATVEIRSVNNRFCEVSVRSPRALNEHESAIQKRVKEAFARGRISVGIQVEATGEDALPTQVNAPIARAYGRLLADLSAAAGIEAPVTLDHLLKFSDVLVTEPAPEVAVRTWEAVRQALDDAIDRMAAMRRDEGRALQAELARRIDEIEAGLDAVEQRAPLRLDEARARLEERLEELLADNRLNPDRLEAEIALIADRLDVTEECVRLHSHLALFREALGSDQPVGRKLNFLAQEINREVNTIGSKANDAEVAHIVVGMKEALEKIREQVENVE